MTHQVFYKPGFYAAFVCAVLLCASTASAQGVSQPTITNIPGGFFIEWAAPVEIAAIQLNRELTGPLVIMFDVPTPAFIAEIDRNASSAPGPELITVLADYWIVRGKPELAIPLYEETLAQGNLDVNRELVFQNNLAMLYSQVLGQHNKALEIVDGALATKRDNVTLLNSKGLILLNAGNPAEAIPVLLRAVELSCQSPIYCMHLATALHREGRPAQARDWFGRVRNDLIGLTPNMTKENREMFDTLQLAYPSADGQ